MGAVSQPESRQRTLAAHLIDLQRLPESRREALPTLGTNLGQKSIFSLRSGVPNNSPNFPVASCSPYPKVCPRERCNWPIQTKINSAAKSCSCAIEVGISAGRLRPQRNLAGRRKMSLTKPFGLQSKDLFTLSDEELMQRVAAGCQDAITVLFDRYHHLVFDVALRIVRDPGEAEEVVQTVFLDIYRAVANFDSRKGILKVWILQYAYHRALHRKRHLASNHFYRWEELEAAIEVGSGRALWGELPETVRLAEEMLGNLKSRQRAVIEMTYYEGLTAEEIARRLGESPHVVRHDLHRGLAGLRAMFGNSHEKA